jgi:hypothetical protein
VRKKTHPLLEICALDLCIFPMMENHFLVKVNTPCFNWKYIGPEGARPNITPMSCLCVYKGMVKKIIFCFQYTFLNILSTPEAIFW